MGIILIFSIIFSIMIYGIIFRFQKALSNNDCKYFGLALPLITFSFSLFIVFDTITSSETVNIDFILPIFIIFNIPTFVLFMIHLDTRIKYNNRDCWYDNSNNPKVELEYEDLIKAVEKLEKVIKQDKENQDLELNDIFRDNLIQSFEHCYDLAFKMLMEYMICAGYNVGISPKNILEKANQKSFINNEKVWLDMINDRNVSYHKYNENLVYDTSIRIKNNYMLEFQALIQKLKDEF